MRKIAQKLVCLAVVISVVLSATVTVSADRYHVEQFVERCYVVVMGRSSDASGKRFWTDALMSGDRTGIEIAYSFFFAKEYKSKNKSDEAYLTDLYNAFLGRQPDTSGMTFYKNCLNSGMNDLTVFNSFAASDEFARICASYGIRPGKIMPGAQSARYVRGTNTTTTTPSTTVPTTTTPSATPTPTPRPTTAVPTVMTSGVEGFVDRLYLVIHGRAADAGGKTFWVNGLRSGSETGISCAYNFFFSKEYKSKNKTNEEYLTDLYAAFFGRRPDNGGMNFWLQAMNNGMDDKSVLNSFATSAEFARICSSYGITPGRAMPGREMARYSVPSSSTTTPSTSTGNTTQTVNGYPVVTITIQTSNGTRTVTGYYDTQAELEIFNMLNDYRRSLGLNTLTRPTDLQRTAELRTAEFSYRYTNWHTRPDGTSCFTAFPSNYGYRAENAACGYSSATEVMNGWRNSSGHNANMINPNYTCVGIGVFVETVPCSDYPDNYTRYYIQTFGA